MLTLNDGRNELWQWDTGRKLTVDADCSQVHFSNKVFGRSIDVDVIGGVATIPDILLQTDKDLSVWAFVGTSENGYTKISKTFKVNRRNKPADYVFTPPDQTTLGELIERLDKIEESQGLDAIKNAVDEYLANNPIQIDEKDPTVPDWAKQTTKPKYTATEVGAVAKVNGVKPDANGNVEIPISDSGGNVDLTDDIINNTLDYLAVNVFSKYSDNYLVKKGFSGTTGDIVRSTGHNITGYIPVKDGDGLKCFANGINWIKDGVDGEYRKIAFYDTSKTWIKTVSVIRGLGTEYYKVENDGYIRIAHRRNEVSSEIYITSLLKKEHQVDLIVFAGQSNMAGRGEASEDFPDTAPTVIPGAGYEFKAITDPTKLYPLAEPFGYAENAADDESGIYDGTKKTGGMAAAFVNAYYANNGNVPVVAVSASEGGSSSSEWLPETGNNFLDLVNRVATARQWLVDNGYSIRHQYCVWCQGESDGDDIAAGRETFDEYAANARAIFTGLIDIGMEKVLLVRIGHHNSGVSTRYSEIIKWQTEEAQTNEALVMVSCDFAGMRAENMMKDAFHYYQKGYNIVGTSAGINSAFFAMTGKNPTVHDPEFDTFHTVAIIATLEDGTTQTYKLYGEAVTE